MMIYGHEAILPHEVSYIKYKEVSTYNQAVSSHIINMMKIYNQAMDTDKNYLIKIKKDFDDRKVGTKVIHELKEGDSVWSNIKQILSDLIKYVTHWIGPCQIIRRPVGNLYMLEYKTEEMCVSFQRVHSQFLKPFIGESS